MSIEALGVAGVFGILAVLLLAWTGYYLWLALRVAASDPVPVGDAAAGRGTGEFVGTATPHDEAGTFDAPFSGERALCSTYRVEQKGASDSWLAKTEGTIARPFEVRNAGDSVLVDPAGATVAPGNEAVRARTGDALPNEVRLRLSRHRSDLDADLQTVLAEGASRSRRYVEGYVAAGDQVHVYGAELDGEPAPAGVDAVVSGGDGMYRITAGGSSDLAWGFVRKAAVVGFVGLISAGGTALGLFAAL